jgi:tetratricopeptide (TPR) repeat protein
MGPVGKVPRVPRVNPERSFEAAARHLFRHVCEIDALRLNPLLRAYFAPGAGSGTFILEQIHGDILKLADSLCQGSGPKDLRAARQRGIIAALCAGKNAEETAAALRMSRSHYYRERYALCARIARALGQMSAVRNANFVIRNDPLRLLFARAESLRDAGSSNEAVRILEDAYSRLTEELAKATVGLGLAVELVFLGRRERARELLAKAREWQAGNAGTIERDWLGDMWTLNTARLESQLGGDAAAGSGLETLAKRRIAERRDDDVTFDAVFLSGEWYRNCGEYGEARKMLDHLRGMEQRLGRTVAKRQIGFLLLAAYCAERSTDEFELAEESLREARDLSIANGTVVGALLAISGLIHHEAARGRDDVVYTMAHEALRLTDGVDFSGFLGYVVAEIIDALLQTRYWCAAAPLVFDAERLMAPGTLRHALLKHAQGNFLFKTGRRNRAHNAMLESYTFAGRLGNRRLAGLVLRDRALMLSGVRETGHRAELMREAVRLIEEFGSANDLSTTYAAAARILGDRRIARLADQTRAVPAFGSEGSTRVRPMLVKPLQFPLRG